MSEAKSLWKKALTGDAKAANALLRRQPCPNEGTCNYIVQMVVEVWLAVSAARSHGGSIARASARANGASHALYHLVEASSDLRRTMMLVGLRHCVVEENEADALEGAEITLLLVCPKLHGLEAWTQAVVHDAGLDTLTPIALAWGAIERATRRAEDARDAVREQRPVNFAKMMDDVVAAALNALQCTSAATVSESLEVPLGVASRACSLVFQGTVAAEQCSEDAERLLDVSAIALRAAGDLLLYILHEAVGQCLAE